MDHTVTITIEGYDPDELSVNHGDMLTVINSTDQPHSLTADDGSFDTDQLEPGEEAEFEVSSDIALGNHPYHCSDCPEMVGVLVVGAGEGGDEDSTITSVSGTGIED